MRSPQDFSLGVSPPTRVPNLALLGQGIGKKEFFENSQTCELELEDQNGTPSLGKLVNDIDLVLAPYCNQVAGRVLAGVSFSFFAPNRQGRPQS